jgi:hypothetical protein
MGDKSPFLPLHTGVHAIRQHGPADADLDHLAQVVPVRLLHCEVAPLLPLSLSYSLQGRHYAQPTFMGWGVTCTSLREEYSSVFIFRKRHFHTERQGAPCTSGAKIQNFLCIPASSGGVTRVNCPAMQWKMQNLSA